MLNDQLDLVTLTFNHIKKYHQELNGISTTPRDLEHWYKYFVIPNFCINYSKPQTLKISKHINPVVFFSSGCNFRSTNINLFNELITEHSALARHVTFNTDFTLHKYQLTLPNYHRKHLKGKRCYSHNSHQNAYSTFHYYRGSLPADTNTLDPYSDTWCCDMGDYSPQQLLTTLNEENRKRKHVNTTNKRPAHGFLQTLWFTGTCAGGDNDLTLSQGFAEQCRI
jgi:hypothetical protein